MEASDYNEPRFRTKGKNTAKVIFWFKLDSFILKHQKLVVRCVSSLAFAKINLLLKVTGRRNDRLPSSRQFGRFLRIW